MMRWNHDRQLDQSSCLPREIIRSLIDRIELTPDGDTLAIKLYGDLAQIIAFSETSADKQKGPVSGEAGPILSVVAGSRNCLDLLLVADTLPPLSPIFRFAT